MRFHGLDTLRAAAIVLVILYHVSIQGLLPSSLSPLARMGWAGVDLFFVLSGFLIGSQLLKPYLRGERSSLREFYLRRAYRILPAFLAVLLLYMLLPLWREAPGSVFGWQYATFTWNLLLPGYPKSHAFSHVWSLCVEEHFYLILPLLLLFCMRKPSAGKTITLLVGIVLCGIGLRAWLLHSVVFPAGEEQSHMMMRYIYYPTYSRLDGLVAGVALALLRTFRPVWWSRVSKYSLLLAASGLLAVGAALRLCAFGYPDPSLPASILFAFPLLAFGFGLLVASAVCDQGLLSTRVPGASTIAALAFSLYLTHKSVVHATHQLLPVLTADSSWRSCAVYAVTCLAAASLLYLGIERPFLRLRALHLSSSDSGALQRELTLDPAI